MTRFHVSSPSLLLRYVAFITWVLLPFVEVQVAVAQVKGNVFIHMKEGGGNGAAYGYVSLGEVPGRTQGKSCPRVAQGNLPTGIVDCSTTYGSSDPTEWQPGDIVTATVPRESSTTIPESVRPPGIFSCNWKFEGFGGACMGFGTYDATRDVWQCQFMLPDKGDVTLEVEISGYDAFNQPCPALVNPFPSSPAPTTSATPFPSPSGNDLLDALSQAAGELADAFKIKKTIKGLVLSNFIPKTPGFRYTLKSQITASSNSRIAGEDFRKKKKKKNKIQFFDSDVILARGKVVTSETGGVKLRTKPTKAGKRLLNKLANGASFTVEVSIEALFQGQSVQAVTATREATK